MTTTSHQGMFLLYRVEDNFDIQYPSCPVYFITVPLLFSLSFSPPFLFQLTWSLNYMLKTQNEMQDEKSPAEQSLEAESQ